MVDFASIYGIANRPTTALQTPMEAMGQALQLKSAMQQGELQGLNLQQQKQAMADAEAFKQDVAAAGGDPEKLKTAMLKRGKVKDVADITKSQKDAEKAQLDAVRAHHQATTDLNGQQLTTLQAARDAIAQSPDQAQAIWDRTRLQLQKNAEPFAGPLKLDLSKTDDPTMFPGIQFLDQKIAMNKSFEQRLKEAEIAKPAGVHAGADNILYQYDRQGQARAVTGPDGKPLKVPPPMSAMMMAPGSQLTPEAVQMLAAQFRDTGDLTKLGNGPMGAALSVKVANEAAKGAQTPDLATAKAKFGATKSALKDFETGGASGKTIAALNTMTEHLATARRMAEALQNGDIQAFNKLRQAFQTQTGQPAPTDFATIKQFLTGEVVKVANGNHITEGELHAASDRLNQAQSPAQLMGALDTMREVAGGKLVSLNQDYQRLKGKSLAEDGRLTPATRAAFEQVNAHTNPGAAASAPKQLTPAELGKLPPAAAQAYLSGKTIQGPDGTKYKKGN